MVRRLRKATVIGAVGIALALDGLAVSGITPNVHNAVPRTAPHDIQAEPAITSSNGRSTIHEYEAEPAIVAMDGHPVSQLPIITPGG